MGRHANEPECDDDRVGAWAGSGEIPAGELARTTTHARFAKLVASGMDVLTVSRRLGHGSPTITLGVYGHLFGSADDRAAQVIETAFGKVLSE